jgi:hypothetical protein
LTRWRVYTVSATSSVPIDEVDDRLADNLSIHSAVMSWRALLATVIPKHDAVILLCSE